MEGMSEQPKAFDMEKVYNPRDIEDRLYQMWEESGAFVAKSVA